MLRTQCASIRKKDKMTYKNNEEQKNLLNQFLASNGVELSAETLDRLYKFADLVVDTKEYGNLISEKDSQKFLSRHIADSLVPYIYIGQLVDPSTSHQGCSAQDDTIPFSFKTTCKQAI